MHVCVLVPELSAAGPRNDGAWSLCACQRASAARPMRTLNQAGGSSAVKFISVGISSLPGGVIHCREEGSWGGGGLSPPRMQGRRLPSQLRERKAGLGSPVHLLNKVKQGLVALLRVTGQSQLAERGGHLCRGRLQRHVAAGEEAGVFASYLLIGSLHKGI